MRQEVPAVLATSRPDPKDLNLTLILNCTASEKAPMG